MVKPIRKQRLRESGSRQGIAAVECAIVAPLLMLLVLGAVDVGQYANVYQKVSDASREGARVAVRYETATQSQVTMAVMNYLQDAFPNESSSTLAGATQVAVTNADGSPISGGNLSSVDTGSQICVTVTLHFDFIRWISHVQFLGGKDVIMTTKMRRE